MRETTIQRVNARVSVYSSSAIYVGTKACEALGLTKNDKVALTFPNAGPDGSDMRVKGYLDSSMQVTATKGIRERLRTRERNGPEHRDAIVEDLSETWEENHDLTESRWDNVPTLPAKI